VQPHATLVPRAGGGALNAGPGLVTCRAVTTRRSRACAPYGWRPVPRFLGAGLFGAAGGRT
jgi:hypothetical protein